MAQVKANLGVRFYTNNDNYDEKRPGWSSTMGPARITKEDYADEYGKKECDHNEKLEELTSSWMTDPNADAVKDRMAEFDKQAEVHYTMPAFADFHKFRQCQLRRLSDRLVKRNALRRPLSQR